MGKENVTAIVNALKELYPDGICSLQYKKDYELLFAVRLSAQCTDERVNMVTPALFQRFPTLESFAEADMEEVGEYIHSCGFFRAKSKDMVLCAQMLLSEYGGKVPDTMEALLRLPGVGRKTANLILGDLFGKPAVVADTHCIRIAGRLGLTDNTDPTKVEMDLKKIIDPADQNDTCHRFVHFGRDICAARAPKCAACFLTDLCPGLSPKNKKKAAKA